SATPPTSPRPQQRDFARLAAIGGTLVVLVVALLLLRRAPKPQAGPALPEASAEVVPPPTVDSVELTVSGTLPPSAQVSVDGQPIEGTVVKLERGSHELAVTAPGYLEARQTLDLQTGSAVTWTPQLVRSKSVQGPAKVPSPGGGARRAKALPADSGNA